VTTAIGANVAWSADGKQIFFLAGPDARGRILFLDVRTVPTVVVGQRGFIEYRRNFLQSPNFRNYDVSPDGRQFVVIPGGTASDYVDSMNLVLNWTEDLKQRLPVR